MRPVWKEPFRREPERQAILISPVIICDQYVANANCIWNYEWFDVENNVLDIDGARKYYYIMWGM